MRNLPFSLKLYRWLLRLYPAGFRENYAKPMESAFREEIAESSGVRALAGLWIRLLADLAISIPVQVSREVLQDLKHSLRLWAGRPWQTGFAIAALAIGIGASTGVFSVVNGLLVRALPFHEPERLAVLSFYEFIPPHDSAEQFHDWRQQSTYVADAALFQENDVNLGGVGETQRAHVASTSWSFFSTLGTQPILGRAFLPGEDTGGRNAVAVIGYGLWQQLFAGDREALGSTIVVDGNPLTIIGVAPSEFDYPGGSVLWMPASFARANEGWDTVLRLKTGISWAQARAAFDVDVDRLPSIRIKTGFPRPRMRSLQDALAGPTKSASLMLLAGVILILLIACTNVANLLMARTADRAAELSIRSALGASRARLAQQLLTECLLLSLAAAGAGLLIAFWTTSVAAKVHPAPLATQSYSVLDPRVLGFAVLASVVSTLLFGVLPALQAGKIHAFGSRGSSETRNSRLIREGLVAAQVMLTIVLLTASISVGSAFVRLMGIDRGYDVKGVVTVNVSLEGTTHQLEERQLPYFEEVLAGVRRLPGVRSASATEFLPLYANMFRGGPFGIDGHQLERASAMIPVLSDYFQTMGGRILHGRGFTDAEVRAGTGVAVVNERFAAAFGKPADAVGRQLTFGQMKPWRIVGVVRGMDYETDPTPVESQQVFVPSTTPGGFFSTFVARVDGRAEDRLAVVRDTIRSVDPQVPVFGVKTMEQRLDEIFAGPKFYRTAAYAFAGFALLLAVIGIYGVASYAVVQRTREMGVRMALGTTPVRLRSMMLRNGLLAVAVGAIPGVAGAMLSGRFLESLIPGAETVHIATASVPVLLITLVASTSIWSATRRIASLDIATILRAD